MIGTLAFMGLEVTALMSPIYAASDQSVEGWTPLRPISFSQNPNVFSTQAVNSAGFWGAYEYDIAKKSLTREVASLPDRDAELLVRDGKLVGYIVPSERAGVDKAVYLDRHGNMT